MIKNKANIGKMIDTYNSIQVTSAGTPKSFTFASIYEFSILQSFRYIHMLPKLESKIKTTTSVADLTVHTESGLAAWSIATVVSLNDWTCVFLGNTILCFKLFICFK